MLLAAGVLQLLGRHSQLVKVTGVRVDLPGGLLESVLSQHPLVQQVAASSMASSTAQARGGVLAAVYLSANHHICSSGSNQEQQWSVSCSS